MSILEKILKISAEINKSNYRVSPCCKNNIYLQSKGSGPWSVSVPLVVFNCLWCARPFGDSWHPENTIAWYMCWWEIAAEKLTHKNLKYSSNLAVRTGPCKARTTFGVGLLGEGGWKWSELSKAESFWDSLTRWGAGRRGWDNVAWEEHKYGWIPLESRHNLSALWSNLCSQVEN